MRADKGVQPLRRHKLHDALAYYRRTCRPRNVRHSSLSTRRTVQTVSLTPLAYFHAPQIPNVRDSSLGARRTVQTVSPSSNPVIRRCIFYAHHDLNKKIARRNENKFRRVFLYVRMHIQCAMRTAQCAQRKTQCEFFAKKRRPGRIRVGVFLLFLREK